MKIRKPRKPRLIQTLPPPMFETVPADSRSFWRVSVQDAQSEGALWFEASLSKWAARDLAIAGARQAAAGRCICTVTRFERGMPVGSGLFAVQPDWNSGWRVQPLGGMTA
ncbi:MAG: hypothetical protein KKA73_16035 [Chloroflexi bacterium]|nr:hypothetical protein [Chloroflexota bacterium]MBU1749195.1 hypothetical protein [Chloroflexota bacterium]